MYTSQDATASAAVRSQVELFDRDYVRDARQLAYRTLEVVQGETRCDQSESFGQQVDLLTASILSCGPAFATWLEDKVQR